MKSNTQYDLMFSGFRITISHPPLTNIKPFLDALFFNHKIPKNSIRDVDLYVDFNLNTWHITNGTKLYYQGVCMATASHHLINAVIDVISQKCDHDLILRAGCFTVNDKAFLLINQDQAAVMPVLAWALTKGAKLVSNSIVHYSTASKRLKGMITPFVFKQSAISVLHQERINVSPLKYTHDDHYCLIPTAVFGVINKRGYGNNAKNASILSLEPLVNGSVYRNKMLPEKTVNHLSAITLNAENHEQYKSSECVDLALSVKRCEKIGFNTMNHLSNLFFKVAENVSGNAVAAC